MRGLKLESQAAEAARLVAARAADALRQTGGAAWTAGGTAPAPTWQLATATVVAAVGVVCLALIALSHALRARDPAGAEPRRSRAATALETKACRELAAHLERQAALQSKAQEAAVCPPIPLGAAAAARGVQQRGHRAGAAQAAAAAAVVAEPSAVDVAPLPESETSGSSTGRLGTARGAEEAAERLAHARAERKRSVMGAPQGDADVVRKSTHDLLEEEIARETPRIRATVYPTH